MNQTYLLSKLKAGRDSLRINVAMAEMNGNGQVNIAAVPAILASAKDILKLADEIIADLETEAVVVDVEPKENENEVEDQPGSGEAVQQ